MHVCICALVCVCVCMFVYVHMSLCMHVFLRVRVYVRLHIYEHKICEHANMHACVCVTIISLVCCLGISLPHVWACIQPSLPLSD